MAVFTKAEAKRLAELDDYYMALLDALKKAGVLDDGAHRRYMLTGYYRLVEFLQGKKLITAKQAQEAMAGGFTSLVESLVG
ncbi:MAG: hypothetical protein JW832_09270 [Deltaproteobacteria bacterium]|nr:hypothetical protein [Deltaproteobacteria bacterium]